MSKKVLILSAGLHKSSNSDLLCDQFLHGAQEAGHDAEKIFLKDKKIHPCTGCGSCFDKEPCPLNDDMPEILDKMIAANVIVMATPVYLYALNAQMKILIDRTCSRYTEIRNKDFYFIMTAANSEKQALDGTIDSFRRFMSCLDNPRRKGFIYGTEAWDMNESKGKLVMQKAFEIGQKI